MFEYFNITREILDKVEEYESENIKKAAKLIEDAILNENRSYIFGASHAGILAQEMFYRAGGLVVVNPIFSKELSLDNEPITITSKMERLDGYGEILADKVNFNKGDVLILHSVSGRNPVTIQLGLKAKKQGVKIIALTNVTYSKTTESRDKSGKLLYELGDIVIDNHGSIGDAEVKITEGLSVGSTSTVIGAAILNTIVSLVAKSLHEKGVDPLPFFYSANIDGGDKKNQEVIEKYTNLINFKF